MEKLNVSISDWFRQSTVVRILFIGFVILVLQIPINMISDQINERQMTKQQAIAEVTKKWGDNQIIIGPLLVVPYYNITTWKDKEGKKQHSKTKEFATFLAESLQIDASVQNEIRSRGIYSIPLYKSEINLFGEYNKPNFKKLGIDASLIIWNEAEIVLRVSDTHSIQKQIFLIWNKKKIAFESGLGASNSVDNGFHVLIGDVINQDMNTFKMSLSLNGSQGLYATPMAKYSVINIDSDWPDPSFQGQWLPTERSISKSGFSSRWLISSISRNFPQQWKNDEFNNNKLYSAAIGVNFISVVDSYRMTNRSIKYVSLFLLMTFVLIWLFEIMTKLRVHMLQYMFIGFAMCLFYLLLLALSEHIGFIVAYIIASIAVVLMLGTYSLSVLKTRKRAYILSTCTVVLYVYLFTLLQEENYSLLFGSLGLFGLLAVVMYITRNVDWHTLGKRS